eukprot:scaffold23461_cov101-Cylindrotheca_fusiformis.AAC.1
MMIQRSIIKAVKNQKPPGRFLAKDSESHRWFEVEDKKVIQKTAQALRPESRQKMVVAKMMAAMAAKRTDNVDGRRSAGPHPHDVLFGRIGETNQHPGNVYWRELVKDHKVEYMKLGKHRESQKRMIALRIIKAIKDKEPPGRFLKMDGSHRWVE